MKKLTLLLMTLFCTLCYGQQNDTIFLKSGKFIPAYKVIGSYLGTVSYVLRSGGTELEVDTAKVKHIVTNGIVSYNDKQNIETKYSELNSEKSVTNYKIEWIQSNLKEYYTEERISEIFYGLSLVSSGVYALKPTKDNLAFIYASAGLGLIGFVIHLDSYKWINRASIEPTLNGIKVKINM
jgi:hypothetical protein